MRYYTAVKNVTCRNCGRPGHLSKNCLSPKVKATLKFLVDAAISSNSLVLANRSIASVVYYFIERLLQVEGYFAQDQFEV